MLYVYVNVNHNNLPYFVERICPESSCQGKKSRNPEGLRLHLTLKFKLRGGDQPPYR